MVTGSKDWEEFLNDMINKTKEHLEYDSKYTNKLVECVNIRDIVSFDSINLMTVLDQATSAKYFKYKEGEAKEDIIGVDCEMVETTEDNMQLARVSAVNIKGEIILDYLVRPHKDLTFVKDYRTFITGLNEKDFIDHSVDFSTAQKLFKSKISENTVIVGHAVYQDLKSLNITGFERVIDTSFLYPVLRRVEDETNRNYTHSLEYLSEKILGADMQREQRKGVHDSIEDADASLKLLIHLFKNKLQNYEEPPLERRVRYKKKLLKNSSVSFALESIKKQNLKELKKKKIATGRAKLYSEQLPQSNQNYYAHLSRVSLTLDKKKKGKKTMSKLKRASLKYSALRKKRSI